jgi:hypothetical protein
LSFARDRRGIISPFHPQAGPQPHDFLKWNQFVIHAKAPHGNSVDGRTLGQIIVTGKADWGGTRRIHVDKAYRGPSHPQKFRVWISGAQACPATHRPRGPARPVEGVGSRTAHWRNSRLCEGVEKGFWVLQIGRGEPFGEPVVDRLEERQSIGGPALVAQQPARLVAGRMSDFSELFTLSGKI